MKWSWMILLVLACSSAFGQATWTQCAPEGGTCSLTSAKYVRYGEPWNSRWTPVHTRSSSFLCANATFVSQQPPNGDPSPGTGKRCETMDVAPSRGGRVGLEWDPATRMVNGDPITERVRYRVWRRNGDGTFSVVGLTDRLTMDLSNEPLGDQCYAVTTVLDPSNSESDLSNAACKMVRIPAPSDGAIERPSDGAIETRR